MNAGGDPVYRQAEASGSPVNRRRERMTDLLHFEDFPAGQVTELGSWTPTAEEIISFAEKWDPQSFHVDEEAAATGPFGGLVASGWHGLCMWGKLYVEAVHVRAASMGGGAMHDMQFVKPIRPGMTLHARITVLEATESKSRPERGTCAWRGTFVDDAGEDVVVLHGRAFFRRRGF
jgi:acyl dehydratase